MCSTIHAHEQNISFISLLPNVSEPEKNVSVADTCVASNEMKNKAYKICREFLSGSWKSISSNDMVFKTVGGGLSNLLYYCSLPETHTPLCGEPSQVLMRMYGQIQGDQDASTITESIICTLLSERALGPKLFGVFPGGRLEEYIPARALVTEQIREPEISLSISRKLARLHALQAPLTKEPTWLFDNMEKWLAVRNEILPNSIPKAVKPFAKKLMEFDYKREMAWLREIFKRAQSPVMFCHNDLQEGNILHMESKESDGSSADENLVFIDFEYCSYNYRGFDIANHFCEWAYDYSHPEYPLFKESIDQYPTEEQRRAFLEEYLKTLKSSSIHGDIDPKVNTIEHLLEETETFTLASHIMWSLWSLNSAHSSKINFGYWEYGAARLRRYLELKERLMERLELSSS
ncbi:choline/ethanolamine kinase [Galendromus occidentalis]|uniref:Choline/ethanolamine kinase n=1 Tax=Galendromus occidentalis TaxID=34638 RepID=A0AAJ6QP86_9ACAR|nr:choline/ethanolamine kinase [Galendromus occidentalis]